MSKQELSIIKRNGVDEVLDIEKIHKMVSFACDDLSGVYPSQVEMNSQLQFYNGITSKEIQEILIKSASNLISLKQPNYQYVAARLRLSALVKEVFGDFKYPHLKEVIDTNIASGVYDSEFTSYGYTAEDIDTLNDYIDHSRDLTFSFAGLQQAVDKYLVQNRTTGKIYETPQFMYMMISAVIFHKYPTETRLKYVKKYYDAISTFRLSLPTPIIAGVRTPVRQYASCCLLDIGDSIDSIFSTTHAVGKYTAMRAGIGLNAGRIRAVNSEIRGGEVSHTGVIPFLKVLSATTRSCSQNGIRGSNATINFMFWHLEVEDLIVLKNNKGTEDTRIRTSDYCIHLNKLFYQRYLANKQITLFSPHDVPDLYKAFYSSDVENFEKLYLAYEKNPNIRKKQINATDFFHDILKESLETGRIYIMNADHANVHGAFTDSIHMTNLCLSGETEVYIRCLSNPELVNPFPIKMKDLEQFITDNGECEVESCDLDNHVLEYKSITKAWMTYESAKTVTIVADNERYKLECTPDHEIHTNNRGYVKAKDLTSEDQLTIGHAYQNGMVNEIIENETEIPVYDITVEDNHNFYANGILVHNCTEIILPTTPMEDVNDPTGEVALCSLSAINLGKVSNVTDLEDICELSIRSIDELFDIQDYPIAATRAHADKRRSIAVGVIGMAHYLAKNKVKYSDPGAWSLMHDTMEAFQYYLLTASNKLAQEKGACEYFSRTKYAQGILPIDTYTKAVDEFLPTKLNYDWELLRANIKSHGLRNSTVSAIAPTESSAVISNETNGIEPPRGYLTTKKSKKTPLKQIVPGYPNLKNYYTLAWDMPDNDGYLKICSAIQKFIDQSISVNLSYNLEHYERGEIPMSLLVRDHLKLYKWGMATRYYINANDDKDEDNVTEEKEEECLACAI